MAIMVNQAHLQFEITIRTEVELPQYSVVALVPVVAVAEDLEVGEGDLSPRHCVLECRFYHCSYHSLLSKMYIFSCSWDLKRCHGVKWDTSGLSIHRACSIRYDGSLQRKLR